MKTVKEFLSEKITTSQMKKAEKVLDKLMNSEEGADLSVAWGDGDETMAGKILDRNKIKGKDWDAIMAVMFGEM